MLETKPNSIKIPTANLGYATMESSNKVSEMAAKAGTI